MESAEMEKSERDKTNLKFESVPLNRLSDKILVNPKLISAKGIE